MGGKSRAQGLVSLFEELPFHKEAPRLDRPRLPPLQTKFSKVSLAAPTKTQEDADQAYSSSGDSLTQSRRYMRAGLHMTFAEFHENLARQVTEEAATFDAAAASLVEKDLSPNTASSRSKTCSHSSAKPRYSESSDSTESLVDPNLYEWCEGSSDSEESLVDLNLNLSVRRISDVYRWITHGIPLPKLEPESDTKLPIRQPPLPTASTSGKPHLSQLDKNEGAVHLPVGGQAE
jgi:hypothetical protein